MRRFLLIGAAIAASALLLGAGGATAASLITSAKIKNGTIKMVDISPSAKKALKGSQGPQGPQGPGGASGASGSQGVQGPAGGFDPAKVSYVAGPTVAVTSGDSDTSVAKCPTGTKVVGGGYFFGYANGGVTVEMSAPLDDGTGWIAGFGNGGSDEGEATAYAVCAAK